MLHDDREVWIRGSADATGNILVNEKLAWERAWKVQNFLLAHGVLVSQMNVEILDPQFSGKEDSERKVSLSIQ
jgi:outer membrane protein OmpA-like peptidoglycan-associated protein